MTLKPPDDHMCLEIILPPIELLSWRLPSSFSEGETWMDELRETTAEIRTDGGRGDGPRGVCTSTCWSAGQPNTQIHTHTHIP